MAFAFTSALNGVVFATGEMNVVVTFDPLKELKVVLVFSFDELLNVYVLLKENSVSDEKRRDKAAEARAIDERKEKEEDPKEE